MDMPKLNIRVYVKKFSDTVLDSLMHELNGLRKKLEDETFSVKLRHCEPYWKIPEKTECIFSIYSDKWIITKDITKHFDLGWHILPGGGCFTRNGIHCSYESEEALWDKRMDNKTFLHENVTWALIEANPIDLDLEYD